MSDNEAPSVEEGRKAVAPDAPPAAPAPSTPTPSGVSTFMGNFMGNVAAAVWHLTVTVLPCVLFAVFTLVYFTGVAYRWGWHP